METYTLKQVAEMGWLSPEQAAMMRAAIAHAGQEVAELAERYGELEARIREYEDEFERDRLIIRARLRSLEQEYQRVASGRNDTVAH